NEEKAEDYVYNYHEFIFYNGVPEAMKIFAGIFGPVIITTNQRGVGKGLMTEHDLHEIHKNMVADITAAGGRIDKIYFATSIYDNDPLRKPQTGMALLAQNEFPQIDFSKSIMVGNNISDMEFGRNAGMHTVFLKTTSPDTLLPHSAIDLAFESLPDFAKALHNK
ncbi:MAG: HAD-IIIA family hydrolase, partial [Bacteroidetes bacterium]|nr:HAD-IIIA family hydrolase [Bacteroidota bacterium]